MILSKNNFQILNSNEIFNLSTFIVEENFKHHSNITSKEAFQKDIEEITKEETDFYKDSNLIVSRDKEENIKGAIRVLRWNYVDKLPLEKIFGIHPFSVVKETSLNNIYHIGRFAIRKDVKDLNMFKRLMVCAIAPICTNVSNVAFAECDSKLLRVISLLGMKAKVIGKSIHYLGSETIPVMLDYDGLIEFYEANKHLVEDTSFLEYCTDRLSSKTSNRNNAA